MPDQAQIFLPSRNLMLLYNYIRHLLYWGQIDFLHYSLAFHTVLFNYCVFMNKLQHCILQDDMNLFSSYIINHHLSFE